MRDNLGESTKEDGMYSVEDWGTLAFDVEAEIERLVEIWKKNGVWDERPPDLDFWRGTLASRAEAARSYWAERQDLNEKFNCTFDPPGDDWTKIWSVSEHIDDYPVLLLGVDKEVVFREDCEYSPKLYSAQTGGFACTHPALHAVKLPLTDAGYRVANEISKKWVDSCVMKPANNLDTLNEYRTDLQTRGLDCNHSFATFHEAWYPVDLEYIRKLADVDITEGESVHDWIERKIIPKADKTSLSDLFTSGIYQNWQLVIVGENCD